MYISTPYIVMDTLRYYSSTCGVALTGISLNKEAYDLPTVGIEIWATHMIPAVRHIFSVIRYTGLCDCIDCPSIRYSRELMAKRSQSTNNLVDRRKCSPPQVVSTR